MTVSFRPSAASGKERSPFLWALLEMTPGKQLTLINYPSVLQKVISSRELQHTQRKGQELPKFLPLIWNASQSSTVRRDVRSIVKAKAFRQAWGGYEIFLVGILCGAYYFFDPEKW